MTSDQFFRTAMETAIERWNALPEEERNSERPYIMGFNAGWEEAIANSQSDLRARHYGEVAEWLRVRAGTIGDLDRHVDAHLFADAIERGDPTPMEE